MKTSVQAVIELWSNLRGCFFMEMLVGIALPDIGFGHAACDCDMMK